MLSTLIQKELKTIIQSPKFVATFAVCSLLLLLSIYIGIHEYKISVSLYELTEQLTEQELREASSWHGVVSRTQVKPDPMQIFVSGLSYDIGRKSVIHGTSPVKLMNSVYSDDPIFATFRFLDLTFIVQVVLSLLAILFTYNAINGERERGTLQLLFSNAIPRALYIIAKCAGAWIGLVVPITVPFLLGLLMVLLFDIPLTTDHWLRIVALMALSLLFFTFFIVLGVLLSAATRHSNVSFMLALVFWVVFVLIIPRAGIMVAGQLVPVPGIAEIEGRHDTFAKEKWTMFFEEQEKRWAERNFSMDEEGEEDEERMWAYLEEDDAARKKMEAEIDQYRGKLLDDLRRRKDGQEKLAFTLTRFSPASAYKLAAMSIAGTGVDLKPRNEDAMNAYRARFTDYIEKKQESAGMDGAFTISISTENGFQFGKPREQATLDLSDMPRYQPPQSALAASLTPAITDFGLLGLATILAFVFAFILFLRYDVR